MTQAIITTPGPLLSGRPLNQVGFASTCAGLQPESAHFYALRPFQRFRIKRWDYCQFSRLAFSRYHHRPGLCWQYFVIRWILLPRSCMKKD
jgi:hypothetical protein